jgi:hypothetical protein
MTKMCFDASKGEHVPVKTDGNTPDKSFGKKKFKEKQKNRKC